MNCFKAARQAAGLTQMELSKRIHVSQGSISQWETGTTSPDIKTLILLADTYGISLDALLMHQTPDQPAMPKQIELPQDVLEIAHHFMSLTPDNKSFVQKQIDLLLIQQATEKETNAV